MKESDYYLIQGWMGSRLQLRGNELICFAVIHSFSRDGESEFKGKLEYLEGCMFASKPTVLLCLNKLLELNLILKNEEVVNGKKKCHYKSNIIYNEGEFDVIDKSKEPLTAIGKEPLPKSGKEPLPANNDNKYKDNKKRLSNDNQKEIDDLFVQFWEKYDYKKGKAKAESAWRKLSKKDKQDAIKAIDVYKEDCRKCDREMKHPATYINQRTWEDDFSCSGKLSKDEEEKEEWPAGITRDQWDKVKLWLDKRVPFIADKITPEMFLDMKGRAHFKPDVFRDIIIEINDSGYDGDILSEFERLRFTEPYATRIDL